MIILFGVDNTGKTTLKNHLKEKFNLREEERYQTRPPQDYDDWFKYVRDLLQRHIENPDPQTIIDRLYIDEHVYGPVLRGRFGLTVNQRVALDILIDKLRPILIWCDIPTAEILKSFSEREQLMGVRENVVALKRKYPEVLSKYPFYDCPLFIVNYLEDRNYEKIDKKLEVYLDERK
jgi:adenylate kinase family enzyme